jgi:hypothetical protein
MSRMKRLLTVLSLLMTTWSAQAQASYDPSQPSFDSLANDVKTLILSSFKTLENETTPRLSFQDIAHVEQVSKAWRRAASDDKVWKVQAAYIFKFNVLPENFYFESCSITAREIYLKHRKSSLNQDPSRFPIMNFLYRFVCCIGPQPKVRLGETQVGQPALPSLYKEMIQREFSISVEAALTASKNLNDIGFTFLDSDINRRLAVLAELYGDASIMRTAFDLRSNRLLLQLGPHLGDEVLKYTKSQIQICTELENLGSRYAKYTKKKLEEEILR